MKKGAVLLCWILLGWAATAQAQQRPLLTEDTDLVKPGHVRLDLGFSFLQNQTLTLFGIPGMDFSRVRGDLARIGEIGVHVGLNEYVEFQIQGPLRNFFTDQRNTISRDDTGDFQFATKFKLVGETSRLPAVGFRVGARLPNQKRLGTSTVSTFGSLLFGKRIGRLNGFVNVGVLIIDRPTQLRRQSDKLLYGMGGIFTVNRRWDIIGEVNGSAGNPSPATEDFAYLRLGARVHAAGLRWDLSGLRGLAKNDAKSGIAFGISYDAPLFTRPSAAAKP